MAEITDITLIDRTTKRITLSDGKRQFHCRGPQNTIAYVDGSGVLRDQDVNFGAETYSKSVSGLWLRNKNSISVGVRLDGVLTKYLGMRPDDCQDGSVQLEFSVENIKLNDVTQSVSLSKSVITAESTRPIDSYGDMIRVFPYRQGCRQLVKTTNATRGFVITYRIHATGLELVSNDLDEFWFANKVGEVKFRIRKPVLCDIGTLEPLYLDALQTESTSKLLTHSLSPQTDGTYLYTKQSVVDLSKYKLPPDFYIDADTVYSMTADGRVVGPTSTTWTGAHDAATGATVNTSSSGYVNAIGLDYSAPNYTLYRSFFYYDISALSGTCTAADFYFFGYSVVDGLLSLQQGTQADTLTKDDFDSFSGSYWGTVALSTTAYAYLSANSTGLSAINTALGSTLKAAAREYDRDYMNSQQSADDLSGLYTANYTGTDHDPYVSLTIAGATSATLRQIASHKFIPSLLGGN